MQQMTKTWRARLGAAWIAAVLLAVCSQPAASQILYGSLTGNVTDPSGASVVGATVTITQTETNQTRSTATNDAGIYNFPTIPGGTYEVRVQAQGFRTLVRKDVTVSTNAVARVDVQLELGAVTESIQVTGETALLQTDRAEVRQELPTVVLLNTPIPPGRNYQQLFNLLPGFSPPRNAHSVPSNPSRSLQFEVNGTVAASNNIRLDGATQYNIWLPHITAYVPALESIETVNVVTNAFDAEQGLAGGAAINVQIKSGTNDLHGSAFWYHDNNKTKARPFFLPWTEARMPKRVYNQNGATLGGPIKKDKLFYFVSYEGTYDRQFAGGISTVPTPRMKQGDMSESPRLVYDPLSGDSAGRNRTPFANQLVPQSRWDPIAVKLLPLLPNPTDVGTFPNNYYSQGNFLFDRQTVDSKVNWNINDRMTSYVRFSWLDYSMTAPTRFGKELLGSALAGGNPGAGYGNTYSATMAYTYTVTPTFVIDTNFGYTLMDTNVEQYGIERNIGQELGIPGTNGARRIEGGWPGFGISGFTTFGLADNYMPYFRSDPQFQWVGNGNWTRGKHNIRFGAELSWQRLNHVQPEFYGGSWGAPGGFSFGGGPTALNGGAAPNQWNGMATFLLGLPTQVGKIYQWPDEYNTRTSMQSLYIRDQWQVNRRLTVNFGARWNYFPMPTRADRGLERYFFPGDPNYADKVMVCGVGQTPKNCGVSVSKRLFAPTVGIAYRLNDRTVIRTGYGVNTDPWNIARAMRTNHPLLTAQTVNAPNAFWWAGLLREGVPVLTAPSLGNGIIDLPRNVVFNTLDSDFVRGYIQSWNFTMQRELPLKLVASAGYVATRMTGFLGYEERNYGVVGGGAAGRIYFPQTQRNVSLAVVNRLGNSAYDSLQLTLDRRFSEGFQINTAYTWSKCISLAGFGNSGDRVNIKIPEFYRLNRSQCGIHTPHRFTANGIWQLPFGQGKRWAQGGAAAALLGGWQINGVLMLQSGNPFSVSSDGASLNAPENSQRADWVGGDAKPRKLGGVGPGQAFYDWRQWAAVRDARFGTAGFNTLLGPGIVNVDLGLFRQFRITEKVNLQFRAEAFNATNTPKFGNPSGNIAGLVTDTAGNFVRGVFEITGDRNIGREGINERVFRFGLRLGF